MLKQCVVTRILSSMALLIGMVIGPASFAAAFSFTDGDVAKTLGNIGDLANFTHKTLNAVVDVPEPGIGFLLGLAGVAWVGGLTGRRLLDRRSKLTK